jgi:cytochrome b involved in lipid metabolism
MNAKALGVIVILIIVIAGGLLYFKSSSTMQTPPTNPLFQNQTDGSGDANSNTSTTTPPVTTSGYTLAEVATHKDASSCWSAINGKVYDLTAWINQHPGGPQRILSICGKDGSSAFNGQHSGQARPADELANFYKGDLATQ